MSINIGNNNKIVSSNIAEKIENSSTNDSSSKKMGFFNKHPIISGFIISFLAGFILLFSFWEKIVMWVEGAF